MATTTTPSNSLYRVLIERETPEAAERSAAAMALVLRTMGHGYATELARSLGVYHKTVKNWAHGTVPLTPVNAVRVASQLASDLGAHPELSEEDVALRIFDLFYSDRTVDAAIWILDSFSTHFRWTELISA